MAHSNISIILIRRDDSREQYSIPEIERMFDVVGLGLFDKAPPEMLRPIWNADGVEQVFKYIGTQERDPVYREVSDESGQPAGEGDSQDGRQRGRSRATGAL
jgi:hypothetical protein